MPLSEEEIRRRKALGLPLTDVPITLGLGLTVTQPQRPSQAAMAEASRLGATQPITPTVPMTNQEQVISPEAPPPPQPPGPSMQSGVGVSRGLPTRRPPTELLQTLAGMVPPGITGEASLGPPTTMPTMAPAPVLANFSPTPVGPMQRGPGLTESVINTPALRGATQGWNLGGGPTGAPPEALAAQAARLQGIAAPTPTTLPSGVYPPTILQEPNRAPNAEAARLTGLAEAYGAGPTEPLPTGEQAAADRMQAMAEAVQQGAIPPEATTYTPDEYTTASLPWDAFGFANRAQGEQWANEYFKTNGVWPWQGEGSPEVNLARNLALHFGLTPGMAPTAEQAMASGAGEIPVYEGGAPMEAGGGFGGGGYGGFGGFYGGYGGGGYGGGGGYSPRQYPWPFMGRGV